MKRSAEAGPGPGAGAGAGEEQAAEIRWVGAQHLMHGYCGRAVVAGRAEVAAADSPGGARAYSVRPTALIASRRHLVVRIGPRPRAAEGQDGETSDARARAA